MIRRLQARSQSLADLTVPHVFGKHTMFQSGRRGETVTVRFAGQETRAMSDSTGDWWPFILDHV